MEKVKETYTQLEVIRLLQKLTELENEREDLAIKLSALQEENAQLKNKIAVLSAQHEGCKHLAITAQKLRDEIKKYEAVEK